MSLITLHPKYGVNPHLCTCPRCGKDNNELVLIGTRETILKCNCGQTIYGHRHSEPCPKCGEKFNFTEVGKIEERDKIPTSLCDDCEKELAAEKEIVAEGGIYFRCKCGARGVIKANAPICAKVRAKLDVPKGPCGIDFDTCPNCEKHSDEPDTSDHPAQ